MTPRPTTGIVEVLQAQAADACDAASHIVVHHEKIGVFVCLLHRSQNPPHLGLAGGIGGQGALAINAQPLAVLLGAVLDQTAPGAVLETLQQVADHALGRGALPLGRHPNSDWPSDPSGFCPTRSPCKRSKH